MVVSRLLYLHCNKLADWSILESLRRLRMLSRLTLHCNPMSGGRSYRPTLIANLPQLRSHPESGCKVCVRPVCASCSSTENHIFY